MRDDKNDFANLAVRVRQGDQEAEVQLGRQLDASLVWIVRGVLRTGRPTTALARQILAEASSVEVSPRLGQEHLVRQVSQRIRDTVLNDLRSAANDNPNEDTVCDR
jgi:hypothetical protein